MTTVQLDTRARAVIERQAVRRRLLETGGSIFGWETSAESGDGDAVVVACASGPGPHAKHRLGSFEPAPTTTQTAMDAVKAASEGRYGYLGSWHTHPRGRAVPSSVDIGTAKAMAEQDDLRLPAPLLLILATTGTSRRVKVARLSGWRWEPEHRRLVEVDIQDCELTERYCPPAALLFAGC